MKVGMQCPTILDRLKANGRRYELVCSAVPADGDPAMTLYAVATLSGAVEACSVVGMGVKARATLCCVGPSERRRPDQHAAHFTLPQPTRTGAVGGADSLPPNREEKKSKKKKGRNLIGTSDIQPGQVGGAGQKSAFSRFEVSEAAVACRGELGSDARSGGAHQSSRRDSVIFTGSAAILTEPAISLRITSHRIAPHRTDLPDFLASPLRRARTAFCPSPPPSSSLTHAHTPVNPRSFFPSYSPPPSHHPQQEQHRRSCIHSRLISAAAGPTPTFMDNSIVLSTLSI
jgi:hypothetical protein